MRAIGWLVLTVLFLFALPAVALAGMPTTSLTEWGAMRIGGISFFAAVLFGSAGMVRWLWNILATDFARLPRLTYGKSLAAVLLLGLALFVVLTMIAGARELLTPGAWKRQGALYAIDSQTPPPAASPKSDDRQESLGRLKMALWQYAAVHHGKFPAAEDPAVADAPWAAPGGGGMRYLYVAGQSAGDARRVLAYEPAVHADPRFVLYTNGDIASISSDDLRSQLDGEKNP